MQLNTEIGVGGMIHTYYNCIADVKYSLGKIK